MLLISCVKLLKNNGECLIYSTDRHRMSSLQSTSVSLLDGVLLKVLDGKCIDGSFRSHQLFLFRPRCSPVLAFLSLVRLHSPDVVLTMP